MKPPVLHLKEPSALCLNRPPQFDSRHIQAFTNDVGRGRREVLEAKFRLLGKRLKPRTSMVAFSEMLPVLRAGPGRQAELQRLNAWMRGWCREEGFGFFRNWEPRNHLLQDTPKKTNNRTPLVITYSPQLKPVQHIINKLQPILEQDTKLQKALGDRPIVSYRQPPNLKMILTNNHRTYHTNTNPGTFPCNKPRCQLCPHIHSADTIIGPNQVSYKIKNTYSCASRNIIYAIMCRKCPSAMYIGQTSQTLRQRINAQKTDIRQDHKEKTVSCHFNQKGHSLNDLTTCILLQRPFTSALERESSELSFMLKFDTLREGINTHSNYLTHYQDSFPSYHL
ncbi:uncharacterized protein LOC142821193 isoform X1 [Pelodiscus sinensis]|uniref:uncharacterized protein LOC142821193 isoform X1 n=1 Tax=Pelodiscus sinensis TaxID=13735 RepID=UPI003F6B8C20